MPLSPLLAHETSGPFALSRFPRNDNDFTAALGTPLAARLLPKNMNMMTGDGPKSKPTTMNKTATFGKAVYQPGQTDTALFLELFPITLVGEVARSRSHTLSYPTTTTRARHERKSIVDADESCARGWRY
jgi:hypothetical protein